MQEREVGREGAEEVVSNLIGIHHVNVLSPVR